nr:DDE-type integrase/transposase/recombinase [Kocuria rhizophila]
MAGPVDGRGLCPHRHRRPLPRRPRRDRRRHCPHRHCRFRPGRRVVQPAWCHRREVLSDNGGAYRSHLWRDTCIDLGIRHQRARPYRSQTNGKIKRFHLTLADG